MLNDDVVIRLKALNQWLPEKPVYPDLPQNPEVIGALARHALRDATLSTADYQKITDNLKEQLDLLSKKDVAKTEEIKYLEKEAFTDPATGHLNKNAFHAALRNIVESRSNGKDKSGEPVTVVVLDLNYLKPFNNISYHGCGDKAIDYLTNFVSSRLRHSIAQTKEEEKKTGLTHKKDDLFTRLSNGDEFAIIMKNCPPEKARERILPILQEMARESVTGKDKEGKDVRPCIGEDKEDRKANLQVSAAFGCAQLPEVLPKDMTNQDIEDVIKKTLKAAGEEEQNNKMPSKKFAASIEGGYPARDDRGEAMKDIGAILRKRFDPSYVEPFKDKLSVIREEHKTGNKVVKMDSRFAERLADARGNSAKLSR